MILAEQRAIETVERTLAAVHVMTIGKEAQVARVPRGCENLKNKNKD